MLSLYIGVYARVGNRNSFRKSIFDQLLWRQRKENTSPTMQNKYVSKSGADSKWMEHCIWAWNMQEPRTRASQYRVSASSCFMPLAFSLAQHFFETVNTRALYLWDWSSEFRPSLPKYFATRPLALLLCRPDKNDQHEISIHLVVLRHNAFIPTDHRLFWTQTFATLANNFKDFDGQRHDSSDREYMLTRPAFASFEECGNLNEEPVLLVHRQMTGETVRRYEILN